MSIYEDAFKSLSLVEDSDEVVDAEDFDLLDKKSFPKMKAIADENPSDEIEVIDTEMENDDDQHETHLGDVILDCPVCHSKIYKSADSIVIEDDSEYANVGEECPYCFTADGFTIVGEVAPYKPEDAVKIEIEDNDEAKSDNDVESEKRDVKVNKDANESLVKCCRSHSHARDKKVEKYHEPRHCRSMKESSETSPEWDFVRQVAEEELGIGSYKDCDDFVEEVTDFLMSHESVSCCLSEDEIHDYLCAMWCEWSGNCIVESYNRKPRGSRKGPSRSARHRRVSESFDHVELETTDQRITVTSEPIEVDEDDMEIAPVSKKTADKVKENQVDLDVEDFDENSFDKLGESYLKKNYNNVTSYKTVDVKTTGNNLIIEGVINFKSGAKKKTQFVFEAKDATHKGDVRFVGKNKQLTEGRNSFTLRGKVRGSRLISESLDAKASSSKNDVTSRKRITKI